ncbi:hypothetical protein EGR_06607 [Echinococcus granulosus]|uniref:Uncharacterized protein n=1 Tax=Echinococcus granulosus TaxID=6210 RepID=W6UAX2_ECHGR|nr:hypothetical protein EGR_06607 [Echinococcus granulosus]EUB58518.1 hypothetical protein EGR_06607 [Echinococcus granulosus]
MEQGFLSPSHKKECCCADLTDVVEEIVTVHYGGGKRTNEHDPHRCVVMFLWQGDEFNYGEDIPDVSECLLKHGGLLIITCMDAQTIIRVSRCKAKRTELIVRPRRVIADRSSEAHNFVQNWIVLIWKVEKEFDWAKKTKNSEKKGTNLNFEPKFVHITIVQSYQNSTLVDSNTKPTLNTDILLEHKNCLLRNYKKLLNCIGTWLKFAILFCLLANALITLNKKVEDGL